MATITIDDLSDEEAQAAAQFFKRLGWSEIRINAVNDNDAYIMRDALDKIQKALNAEGFDPR